MRSLFQECVRKTKSVQLAMDARKFEEAASLRGRSFLNNLNSYRTLHNSMDGSSGEINTGRNLAVVRCLALE